MQKLVLAFAALLGFSLIASYGLSASDAAKTVASACTRCHSTERICRNLNVFDGARWEATVARMHGKGAAISGAQVGEVAAYLASTTPTEAPFCN